MRTFIFIIALFVGLPALAQDTLLKSTGEELEVKVIRLDEQEVHYKRFVNLEGPLYILPLSEVFMIKLENGEKHVFSDHIRDSSSPVGDMTRQQLYRQGMLDAEENYSGGKDIAIAALVTGFSPILGIPAMAIVAVTDPNFQPGLATNPELFSSQSYREGYVKRTKQLSNQSYLKGAGVVVALYMVVVGIIVSTNQ